MGKNYKQIGFKAGIEIHQQLETGKLFCRCPSIVHDKHPDIHFTRRLTARAGEGGKMDAAALAEMKKQKYYVYEGCSTSSCLVEADEEPPSPMNEEALQIVLQVAKLVHATVIDEIQVMRKIVVDGSNTSGFQRTALVAVNGFIETSKGRVSIPGINIEEESARKVESTDEYVKYRLDRLGVCLIEIATGPELQDPDQVKEAAEKLGMILRSTRKMKRGIGTIRQDVNTSIKGGARTEIKGFQDLKSIPKVIDFEITRQQKLIHEGVEVKKEVRKAEPDFTTSYLRPMPGAARMYPETDIPTITITQEMLDGLGDVELIEEVSEKFIEEYKLDKDIARKIAKSEYKDFFTSLITQHKNIKPAFIADVLLSAKKQSNSGDEKKKARENSEDNIQTSFNRTEEDYEVLFEALDTGKIAKESVATILQEQKPLREVIDQFALMSDAELEKALREIISQNKDAPSKVLIGKAMGQLRGKAEGKKIAEMLRKMAN